MELFKEIEGELRCGIEDAIIYENNTFRKVKRIENSKKYEVSEIKTLSNSIGEFVEDEENFTYLDTYLERENNKLKVIAGATSWEGEGFVALKSLDTNKFSWVLILSSMEKPIELKINLDFITLENELNINFVIPINEPENFKVEFLEK